MKLSALLVENKELSKCNKMREIVVYILEQIKNIDVQRMKMHPEFIKFVCEIIENQVSKKESSDKIDKMSIFVDVMKEIHLNEEQISESKSIVEFLLTNKMIKKTPFRKIVWYCVKKYFIRQVSLT